MKTIFALSLIAFIMQCTNPDSSTTLTREGFLAWTGPLAADGCGFFITIDDTEYKPVNDDDIPTEFQLAEASQPVTVTYELVEPPETYSCGMMGNQMDANLRVIKIEAR